MRIGAHVAVLGNYLKMKEYADSVGCECVQIFAKNARQYKYSAPKPERLEQMAQVLNDDPGFGVYSHTAYLINLSSLDDDIREKSTEALAGELAIGAMLGLDGVNTHVGNDKGGDDAAAADRAADSICRAHARADEILENWCGSGLSPAASADSSGLPVVPPLILEDAAGAGNQFGCTVSQMALIVDGVLSRGFERGDTDSDIALCIDTCHAWAQGYDVASADGWIQLIEQIDESMGIGRLHLIHSNDSKFGRGEHKDRHEWVGKGHIGPAGFEFMMTCDKLQHTDVILEIPGEVPDKDIENIELLKNMRSKHL